MGTPRGFKDISTTYQLAYMSTNGNVQVRKIGTRLWEILARGGVSVYETAKEAALKQARKLAGPPSKRKAGKRVKRKVRR
jgi:hypothetical protein